MLKRMRIADGKVILAEGDEGAVHVYTAPDAAERKYLIETLKMDEHTMNSALDPDEMARLEFEPEHVAMIIKRPKNYCSEDNFLFKVASIGLFLFKDRLIVVINEQLPMFEGREFARVNSIVDLMLRVIYRSIFHFEEHLKVINALSDQLEKEISQAMENKHLLNLFTLEKSLVYYLNAINSNAKLIERLRNNAAKVGLTPEHMEFLDDVTIENGQCYEQASIYSQVLSGLMDARVSIVSNNLNVLMKTLTLVMIAIMMPQLVVSIFSMNVRLPVEQQQTLLSFWIIMILSAASTALVWFIYRYKKW